jgi:hypothetical protein
MDPYEKLIEAATDYLRSIGAGPVVIGGAGIMPSVDLPLNHYLTVKWTGTLPDRTLEGGGE